jgi:hypothetical protein
VTKALADIINALADVGKPESFSIIRRLFVRN